jgi:hypothetical protein
MRNGMLEDLPIANDSKEGIAKETPKPRKIDLRVILDEIISIL